MTTANSGGEHQPQFNNLLREVLDNAYSAIYVKDREGRFLLVNRQFERLFGLNRDSILGRVGEEIFPPAMASRFRRNYQRVIETGQPVEFEEDLELAGGVRTFLTHKFPLADAAGEIWAIAGISLDGTHRIQARRDIERLHHRTELILNSVADGICSLNEDGKIMRLNPSAEKILQWTTRELEGQPYSVIVQSRDEEGTAVADDAVSRVLHSGMPCQLAATSFRRKNGSLIPVEFAVCPIFDAEDGNPMIVGAVLTFRDRTQRLKYQRTEHELTSARRIQQALYPESAPRLRGFDISGTVHAASKACGDYYDFISRDENSQIIAVGDVSGHGLGSALQMVETRAMLRALVVQDLPVDECLEKLNRLLSADLIDEMFVSLFLAQIDADRRELIYASAGHEAVIVTSRDDVIRLTSTGIVLGLVSEPRYTVSLPISLKSGDIVVITTDGVVETQSPTAELFGLKRMIEVVRQHRRETTHQIHDAIYAAARLFAQGRPQEDDVTIAVAKAM